LSVRAQNVLKELAVELIQQQPPNDASDPRSLFRPGTGGLY